MKKVFLLFLFYLPFNAIVAQYLHTPAEMLQIMQNSTEEYKIDTISSSISSKNLPIVHSGWYQLESPDGLYIDKDVVLTNRKMKKYHQKGIKYIKKEKFIKAIKLLHKAYEESPNNGNVIKTLGMAYLKLDDLDNSKHYYEKALSFNYIDFEAHFQLALINSMQNNPKKAIQHISTAHLLNRNDSTIVTQLVQIYAQNQIDYKNWVFAPNLTIQKTVHQINIKAPREWVAYANCKAVWAHEPGYQDKMKVISSNKSAMIQEKECILNAIIDYEVIHKRNYSNQAMDTFSKAMEKQYEDEYINYEILSLSNPLLMSYLSKEELDRHIYYLTQIRSFKIDQ